MIDIEKELNGTYQVRQRSETLLEVVIEPASTWSYFVGHFPQMPVLPAVAIVDVSQFFIEDLIKSPSALARMTSFRIKNPVQPGDKILIRVQQEAPWTFNVLWKSPEDEKVFADISLQVSEFVSH
jgi:3-hydroxymyristoyl/3-hydroxydecanoyl-(acyl carrier protein) dehydratase